MEHVLYGASPQSVALTSPALLSPRERREKNAILFLQFPSLPLGERGQGSEGHSAAVTLIPTKIPP
jgi:hypothetical protein